MNKKVDCIRRIGLVLANLLLVTSFIEFFRCAFGISGITMVLGCIIGLICSEPDRKG